MVYDPLTMIPDPVRALAIRYAPRAARPAVAALLALDDALASVVRTTHEPLVGEMRLTWWDERLRGLDRGETVAQPVLAALPAARARGVSGAELAAMIDGWEILLDETVPDDDALLRFAKARGETLFAAIGTVCRVSANDPIAAGGVGWALADFARNVSDALLAERARALAAPHLAAATRWSRDGRALGALVHIARTEQAAPVARLARLLFHRFSGR